MTEKTGDYDEPPNNNLRVPQRRRRGDDWNNADDGGGVMTKRREGWYWVKVHDVSRWEAAKWDGYDWTMGDSFIIDGPHMIGPRIPTPDEPWQCVPVEPTREMKIAADIDTPGPMTAYKCWQVMLAAAPKPEDG